MAIEITAVDRWLYEKLTDDAALMSAVSAVYGYVAPPAAVYPFVLFSYLGGTDVAGQPAVRILTSGLWQVKVVGASSSFLSIEQAAKRIDELLQGASSSGAAADVYGCVRTQPLAFTELGADNRRYQHLGGIYRIYVKAK